MPTPSTTIKTYLHHLERGDVSAITALFAPSAKVHSPLFGTMHAAAFYQRLSHETTKSELKDPSVYLHESDPLRAVVSFTYHWTLTSGKTVSFPCVDLFGFNENGRIAELTILYDAQAARGLLE